MAACSSSTSSDDEFEPDTEDAGETPDVGNPDVVRDARPDRGRDTGSDVTSDSSMDAGKDAHADGAPDAKKDAPDSSFAETGSPCSPLNAVQTQKCGLCGQQQRVCIDPDAEDGGNLRWQEWGACVNEVDGGCVPGTTVDAGCGRCGSAALTCSKSCTWPTTVACKNEGPCWPGEVDSVLSLSCDAGLGRERSCDNTCEWSAYGSCEVIPDGIEIPTTVDGRTGKRITLGDDPKIGYHYPYSSSGSCGDGYWNAYYGWSQYVWALVELKNPTSNPAVVSVWTYKATGAGALSPYELQIRALSSHPNIPDAGVEGGYYGDGMYDCSPNWSDYCCNDNTTDPTACVGKCSMSPYWGGLMNSEGHGVTVPANGSVWVFVQDLYGSTTPGDVMIGVKTHSI
jgi:hypothetical protein